MKRTNTAVWIENRKHWKINVQKEGERRSFYCSIPGRNGQRECNAKADAWLDGGIKDGNLRAEVLFDEFITELRKTSSPEYCDNEMRTGTNWIKPYIGKKRIGKITEDDLQNILDNAAERGISNPEKGLSKKTIANIRATVMAFFKFCRKKKVTQLNPEFLTIARNATAKTKRILQPDDLIKLFSVDQTMLRGKRVLDEYIYAYRFLVVTGLRPGELRGLKREDIIGDFVQIKRSINIKGRTTSGKNKNALRSFALTKTARVVLDQQMALEPDTEYIFDIFSQSTFFHRWSRFCEVNEIPHISLYELRHTFVSMAKQLTDGELRALVGHSKSMDTYGVYSHELDGDRQRTAEKLDLILDNLITLKIQSVV